MPGSFVVHIVDDDEAVRQSLAFLLSTAGIPVRVYESATSFLAGLPTLQAGCLITDVRMPDMTGLELLQQLRGRGIKLPVIVITGHGDIPLAVEAMKCGALDFIEKPFDAATVVTRVRDAVEAWARRAQRGAGGDILSKNFPGHDLLTSRERDVLGQIAAGSSNKQAGRELGISPRTIEVHRARIMEKLSAKNAADLVRIVLSESRSA